MNRTDHPIIVLLDSAAISASCSCQQVREGAGRGMTVFSFFKLKAELIAKERAEITVIGIYDKSLKCTISRLKI